MGWETRFNQSYLYRKEWRNGRCVSIYLGKAEWVGFIETLDAERRADAEAERERLELLDTADAELDKLCESVRLLTKQALLAAGFHQHKGTWRRKRMAKKATQDKAPRDVAMELYKRAKRPGATPTDITAALVAIEADGGFNLADATNGMKLAADALIERMTAGDAFSREAMLRRCKSLAAELAQPNDGPLERILIEQITLCWLRMGVAEQKYTAATTQDCSIRVADHWEKKLSSTQKRYTRAIESLARVRKLMRPKVQVGIGTINAALVNHR